MCFSCVSRGSNVFHPCSHFLFGDGGTIAAAFFQPQGRHPQQQHSFRMGNILPHTSTVYSPALPSHPASLPIPTALAYSLAPTQKTKQKLKTFVTLNSSMSCLNILLAGSFLQDIFQVSSDLLSYPYVAYHLAPINLYLVY